MNAQPAQTIKNLLKAIAAHFPDWKLTVKEMESGTGATFRRADGAAFTVWNSKTHRPERFFLSGNYGDMSPEWLGVIRHHREAPEISVSCLLQPAAIVKAINRRFLLRYVPIFEDCLVAQQREDEAERQRIAVNRLHRAAPDLLAALQDLLEFADTYGFRCSTLYEEWSDSFEAAFRACASATHDLHRAAPDLLAALQDLLNFAAFYGFRCPPHEEWNDSFEAANCAIAAAIYDDQAT